MEARLKAILEMDASELQKELVKSVNELKKFEREIAKTTDTQRIGELTSKISEMKSKIAQLTPAMQQAGNATAKAGAAMGSSSAAAMNFSRVIQDLPFGFMGIQNNLTQLIPGIGAAGIAFSALTAAITFSQVGLTYWTKKSKDAKEAADEFLTVTREANKNAAQEVVNSRLLYQAATNTANAMDARLRAAKELQKEWPSTFANYTAEEIALGKAKKGYEGLTSAIIANARAAAAKNKIIELEADKLNRLENIQKIKAITDKEAAKAYQSTVNTIGGEGKAPLQISQKIITVEEKRAVIQDRRNKAIQKELDLIKQIEAKVNFYGAFAGATNLQQSVTPGPPPPKKTTTYGTPTQKDGSLASMIATSNDWQQKKGKWWRETGTMTVADTSLMDTTKVRLEDNKALNQILAEQANVQANLNAQIETANSLAEYGGAVFGQMAMAMMQGSNIGDVLATTFKNLVSQLIQAVAQAAIFAAIMSALPGGSSFGTLFGANLQGGGGGGMMNIFGMISGQNIELSNQRTSTGMGFRRGRRR